MKSIWRAVVGMRWFDMMLAVALVVTAVVLLGWGRFVLNYDPGQEIRDKAAHAPRFHPTPTKAAASR